jgi:hypothetical protein
MPDFPPILTRLLRLRPHAVELLRPRPAIPPLAWVLLGAGAVALGSAVLACQPAWTQGVALAADQANLQTALDRAADSLKPRPAVRSSEHDTQAEAALIVAEARRPWHQLFDQIEAAQQGEGTGVHLVQIAVDPRFSSLQMVAEGRDLGGLVRFSGQMAGKGPIRTIALTHHEWRDALGAHVVTASLQGELDASSPVAVDGPAAPSKVDTP